MSNARRASIFNILTIIVLAATVCLSSFYGLAAFGIYNPFPAPTVPPTSTPTPVKPTAVPSWTPTVTLTPRPATRTPRPTLTPSVIPTFPPSPTFPPTATPTLTATLSPWPFTYELSLRPPQYGCRWTGVAGQVQDLDGNPLIGYPVHVWGAGVDTIVTSGADARFNTIYGHDAAWEQFLAPNAKPIEVRVQLHDPYSEEHPPVSEEIVVDLPGYCGGALAYIVFTQNH